ncbi:MAG: hypothetical protein HC905_00945 [Bacteroidales bacterium]|nr:hypothetical protein [Bacteroidales bacterium]
MSTSDQDIWEIITAVLKGNPTQEEQKFFEEWINENPKNKKFFDSISAAPLNLLYTTQDKKEFISKFNLPSGRIL